MESIARVHMARAKQETRAARTKKFELDFRRMWVARFYLERLTQDEIVERLAGLPIPLRVDRSQVSRDITALRQTWQVQSLASFTSAMAMELAKVDHLERVYWQYFQNSQKPKTRRTVKKAGKVAGKAKGKKSMDPKWPGHQEQEQEQPARYAWTGQAEEAEMEVDSIWEEEWVEERDGSLASLKGIQWCIEKRCKLMGLDAPDVIELAGSFAGFTGSDAAKAEKELDAWKRNMEGRQN